MSPERWFSNRGQFLQLVVSVIACAIAGANAWSAMQKSELTSPSSILFYVLVLIVVLSVLMVIYRPPPLPPPPPPPPPSVDVKVTDPDNSVKAQGDAAERYFDAVGTLSELPSGIELWAFVKDANEPRWWPHGPAIVSGQRWKLRVKPGPGSQIRFQVALVGKNGQALIRYYKSVGSRMRQVKDKLKAHMAESEVIDELKAPAIGELGSDIVIVHDKFLVVES